MKSRRKATEIYSKSQTPLMLSNITFFTSETWSLTIISLSMPHVLLYDWAVAQKLASPVRDAEKGRKLLGTVRNSLLRLLAVAVPALPPPYLFIKSVFNRSVKQ